MDRITNQEYKKTNSFKKKEGFNRISSPSLNVFCNMHPRLRVEYVSVDPAQETVFKCVNCISEENIPQQTLIPINLIQTAENSTIFTNFPITDRSLAIELRTFAEGSSTSVELTAKISHFFKELRCSLFQKLEMMETKIIGKAKGILDFRDEAINKYNSICQKNQLKQIVNNVEKSIKEKSDEIQRICSEVLSKETENNASIRLALDRSKVLQSFVDFKTPDALKDLLLSHIEKIDMFLVEDTSSFQELIPANPSNSKQKIQNLMKLVQNKLNGVSQKSSKLLEKQLNRISSAFSLVDVPDVGEVGVQLNTLNQQSSEIVIKLIGDLAKNQQRKENEKEEKDNLIAREIVKLKEKKPNICSKEFIEDVSRVITILENVVGQFTVRKTRMQLEVQEAVKNLNLEFLLDLSKLEIKINQITQQISNSDLSSKSPQFSIQSNPQKIDQIIGKIFNLNKQLKEKTPLNKSIFEILVAYPIFEIVPPISYLKYYPIPINFRKTNYSHSQEIQISEIDDGSSFQYSLPNPQKYGQVVSNILDNNLGYMVKLKFTKPIGAVTQNGFMIGLIPDSKIDSEWVLQNSFQSGLRTELNDGAKIVVRGNKLTSSKLRESTDSVEFRFCISERLFFYADPSYSNINQAEQKHFKPSEVYRFGVCFGSFGRPNDMDVIITEFAIIDSKEVNFSANLK